MNLRTEFSAKTVNSVGRGRGFAGRQCLAGLLLILLLLAVICAPAGAARPAPGAKGHFSLDFINSELVDVLKALATQSGVNVVLTSSVKGQTTLSLHNVTLEEALRLVTASNGLDYAWVDVAYVVGTPEEVRNMRVKELSSRAVLLRRISPKYAQDVLGRVTPEVAVSYQEGSPSLVLIGTEAALNRAERTLARIDVPLPPSTRMIGLVHAGAAKVADLLKDAVPDAIVQMGPQENSLLITADSVRMEQTLDFIKAIDVIPPAAQAYTVMYDIKFANSDELKKALDARFGKDLICIDAPRSYTPTIKQASGAAGATSMLAAPQATGGSGGGGGATSGVAGVTVEATRIERLVLMGAEYTVGKALALLQDLDVSSKLVRIRAVISRINRDKLKQLGIDWFVAEGAASSGIISPIEFTETVGKDNLLGRFARTPLDFVGAVRALESKGYGKILAEPTVATLDGRQVSFHSGQKIFYQTTIGFNTSGNAVLDIREVDVGVTLVVTPQVNPDGEITLTMSPTVSSASFRQELGTALPIVDERTAIATVRVKKGESVVIAGLVEETVTDNYSQVPLLGKLPLIGQFFRSNEKQHSTDELVIMVSPEVVQ
jgi:type II secretory pathway component GspD/PulD (secretin)